MAIATSTLILYAIGLSAAAYIIPNVLEDAADKIREESNKDSEPEDYWQDTNGDGVADEHRIPLSENDPEPSDTAFTITAATYPIPNGSITISADGSFTGQTSETNDYGGNAPSTVDNTTISGRIDTTGAISGSFVGTDTHVEIDENGTPTYDVRDANGDISGQVYADGVVNVSWTGPYAGSSSGQIETTDVSELLIASLSAVQTTGDG